MLVQEFIRKTNYGYLPPCRIHCRCVFRTSMLKQTMMSFHFGTRGGVTKNLNQADGLPS